MKLKRTSHLLALLLAAVMLLGLLPVTAAAEGDVSLGTVPTDIRVANTAQTFPVLSKTSYTQWNAIDGSMDGETISCEDIYMITLESENDSVILDITDEYAGIEYFTNQNFDGSLEISDLQSGVSFSDLYNDVNDDGTGCFAITGAAAKTGISLATIFGLPYPEDLSENDKVIFICGIDDGDCWDDCYAEVGYIIRVASSINITTQELKEILLDVIESVPTSGFYDKDDRYNGKPGEEGYNDNGFWADMRTKLSIAQDVYSKDATQSEIIDATKALSDAIGNLISTDNINTTLLYEASLDQTYYWFNGIATPASEFTGIVTLERVDANNCSPASWTAYQDALDAAKDEMEKLFNDEGKPTAVNVSGGEEEEEYKEILAALQKAIAGLDERGDEDDLLNAQFSHKQLEILSRRANPIGALSQGDYSTDSWDDFSDAADAAAKFLAAHPTPQGSIGKKEAAAYYQELTDYWNAGYSLEAKTAETAKISVVDSYAARKGTDPSKYAGTYTVDIPAGGLLLHDALCTKLGDNYTLPFDDLGLGYGVYINGVFVFISKSVLTRPNSTLDYRNIRLKDGDEVVIALMQMPTYANLSGGLTFRMYRDVHDALRYLSFRQNGAPVEEVAGTAGETISLTADFSYASLMDYSGSSEPLSGAKVMVSAACSTKEAALKATATEDTGVVTGSDGSFGIALFSAPGSGEGWYALNLLAADEYGSLANGANIIIHVTDDSDLSELKAELLAQLEEVYTAYDDSFYTTDQLKTIRTLHDTGVFGVTDAATSGDAEAAFRTAYDGIKAIQESNKTGLSVSLTAVRNLLERLPTAEDLGAGKLYLEDKPILDLLFGTDGWYVRMTDYQKESLTADETELLSAFQKAWTDSNQGATLPALPVYTVKVETRDADNGSLLDLPITVTTSGNYAFSYTGWNVDGNTGSLDITGSTSLGVTFDAATNTYTLPAGAWYIINLGPYVAAADRSGYSPVDVNHGFTSDIDFHYRVDKDLENSNLGHFYPIRKNAVITLYYRVSDEVSEAKAAALAELKTAYESKDRNNYTEENWQALNDAYLKGQTDINAAGTVTAVNDAKKDALDAMHDVPERVGLGSVYVTVRNDTYPTSKGAPWDGLLVDRKEIPLNDSSTMMSCIVAALELEGYAVVGAETNYISSINGLKEFDGGRQSGWMGCLNDWFVNEGFANFSVENGKLHDGDVISVEYTCAFGGDIRAGTETNHDTSLYLLTLTNGTLTPKFDSAVTEYVFTLNSGVSSTKISFSGNNRAFQARAYLNGYAPTASNWIRSGDTVTVSGGDVITVGVGEGAWPAMGTGVPTKYKVTIVSANDASGAEQLINAIGSVTYSNYKDKQAAVDLARAAYEALTDAAKQNVTNYAALTAAEDAIEGFEAVMALKAAIAALPRTVTEEDREAVEAAKAAYDALTPAQQNLLTVAETRKLEAAVATLEGTVVPVTGVTLNKSSVSVAIGETVTLTAAVEPEDATDPTVTWLSSDESIATVADGVVTGVKAGTATITAQAGEETASCVVTVTAPAPAAPTGVTASAAAGKITLSWDTVEGAAKYLIQRRAYDGSAWSSYATLKTLTGASYVDAAVTAGSRYQYRVRAYNGSLWGAFGASAAVTVPAAAPAAPVISAEAEDGKVTVQWAEVDNATKYVVYRRANVSGAWESAWTQFTATGAGFEDGSVTASTKYQYRVRAYGSGGWSGFSNALTVTTPAAAPTVPAAPTGVTAATANGSKVVTLSWDAVEGADSFVIYRRAYNNETASWGGWEQFTSSTNGYVDEGADYGTIYKYRIKAKNAVGLSKTFSEDATAKTPPATPTISSVKVETGKVTVSWGAESGATRYQVFRRAKDGNRWGAMTRLTTTTETSYVDTTAEAGTVYQYLVKSYNGGYSGYSAGKQITAE